MRIQKALLVAKPWRGGLADYIFRALKVEFGSDVHWLPTYPISNSEKANYRKDRNLWRKNLVSDLCKMQYDFALFINYLPEFESLGHSHKHALWLTDDPRPIASKVSSFSNIFLSDPGYLDEFEKLLPHEAQVSILPFGCDPEIHKQIQPDPHGGLCFLGNRDPKRTQHLKCLLTNGKRVSIYGNYFLSTSLFWKSPWSFRPKVEFSKMSQVYCNYTASLNIHAQVVRGGTNMRTFECAAVGIPQLVEFRPGLGDYFSPEEDLLVYHDEQDLCASYDQIMGDAELRRKMVASSRKIALDRHTYRHRVRTIVNSLK